jgi:penicillin amidase
MDFQRRVGHGRLAEVLGPAGLEADRFVRTIGLTRAAQADLEALTNEDRALLDAYVAGVNAAIDQTTYLPWEFRLLGYTPEPWRAIDCAVWGKAMQWDQGDNWESELLRARIVAAVGGRGAQDLMPLDPSDPPLFVPPESGHYHDLFHKTSSRTDERRETDSPLSLGEALSPLPLGEGPGVRALAMLRGARQTGSNAWAVAGRKTDSGGPILAGDPHLDLRMPSIWYEVGMHGTRLDVVGGSLPGLPGIVAGHSPHLAWGLTSLVADQQDLYLERLDERGNVMLGGQWRPTTIITEEIRIKSASSERLHVRLGPHGPLISEVAELELPTSLRWVALERPGSIIAPILAVNRATTWTELKQAASHIVAPGLNVVFADADGNIGRLVAGRFPRRRLHDGLLPVPGWLEEYEWDGFVAFDELPTSINPDSGLIVSANERWWPDDYAYPLSRESATRDRYERAVALLESASVTDVETMRQVQADVHEPTAADFLGVLVASQPPDYLGQWALESLHAWDGQNTSDSVGAAIYHSSLAELSRAAFADELGEDLYSDYRSRLRDQRLALAALVGDAANAWWDDVRTPERETREDIAARAVSMGAAWLGRQLGDLPAEWQWGDVHFTRFSHPLAVVWPLELVLNVRPVASAGSYFTLNNAGYDLQGQDPFMVRWGASYRRIIDLGDSGRSRSVHPPGQSGHVLHPHRASSVADWQAVRYHPVLVRRSDIERVRQSVLTLVPAGESR